jgi:hypothetical protein
MLCTGEGKRPISLPFQNSEEFTHILQILLVVINLLQFTKNKNLSE